MDVQGSSSHPQIQDPFLLSVLRTNDSLRAQSLALLDLVSKQHEADESPQQQDSQPSDPSKPDLEVLKAQRNVSTLLAAFRSQNHRLAMLARETKSETSSSRAEVDHLHLSLQNLYYEQRHLMGDIASCENYPHPYARLPMVPEDEFLDNFPEWKEKKMEESNEESGEQGLMSARIEHENQERQNLRQKVNTLSEQKQGLRKENDKRKQELVKLDKDLETFIEAAKPIQKTFEKEY